MNRVHFFALVAVLTVGSIVGAAAPSFAGQTQIATMGQLQAAYANASTELTNYSAAKNALQASQITFYDAGPLKQANKAAFKAMLHQHRADIKALRAALASTNVLGADTGTPGDPPVTMAVYLQANGLTVKRFIAVHVTAAGAVQLYYV